MSEASIKSQGVTSTNGRGITHIYRTELSKPVSVSDLIKLRPLCVGDILIVNDGVDEWSIVIGNATCTHGVLDETVGGWPEEVYKNVSVTAIITVALEHSIIPKQVVKTLAGI